MCNMINPFSKSVVCVWCVAGAASAGDAPATQPAAPKNMVYIAAGEFTMGTDDPKSMPNERPAHRVHVDAFFMDETAVTNQQKVADIFYELKLIPEPLTISDVVWYGVQSQ